MEGSDSGGGESSDWKCVVVKRDVPDVLGRDGNVRDFAGAATLLSAPAEIMTLEREHPEEDG